MRLMGRIGSRVDNFVSDGDDDEVEAGRGAL